MKIEKDTRLFKFAVYAFLTGIALIACYLIFSNIPVVKENISWLVGIFIPFIWGISIAYILNPIMVWSERFLNCFKKLKPYHKTKRGFSIIATYIITFTILGIFFSIVLPEVSKSLSALLGNLSGYIANINDFVNTHVWDYLNKLQLSQADIERYISPAIDKIANFDKYISMAINYVISFMVSTSLSIKNVLLATIISIYLLISKETFLAQTKKIIFALSNSERSKYVMELCAKSNQIFSGFISGKILDSIIIGIMAYIGLSILDIHYALLISVIIGFTNVIPFFGPFIGAIPSILLLLMISPKEAFIVAIFILVLQQFDGNILGPKILGDATGLSSFWVIFAVLIAGSLLGVVGMFLGVPIFAVIYTLVKEFIENQLRKKNLPIDTDEYKGHVISNHNQ